MYLEHANITVSDLDDAVRFFSAAFPDFYVRGRGRAQTPGNERDWLHIGNETNYLALEEANEEAAENAAYRKPGFNHIGFVVEDLNGIIERLKAAGYEEGITADPHPFRKRVYFLDSDGSEYEFVEYLSEKSEEKNEY